MTARQVSQEGKITFLPDFTALLCAFKDALTFLSHIFSSYLVNIVKTKLVVFRLAVISQDFLDRRERPRPLQSADGEVMPHVDQSRSTSKHFFFRATCFYHLMLVCSFRMMELELNDINAVAFNSIFLFYIYF